MVELHARQRDAFGHESTIGRAPTVGPAYSLDKRIEGGAGSKATTLYRLPVCRFTRAAAGFGVGGAGEMGFRCFMYFVTSPDRQYPVKIGISDYPDERLASLQMYNPAPLKITELIRFRSREEALLAEQTVHAVLAATGDRLHGEWFRPSPNVAQVRLLAHRLNGRHRDGFVDAVHDLQSALAVLPLVKSDTPDDWAQSLVETM